jgi:hypothetical protein
MRQGYQCGFGPVLLQNQGLGIEWIVSSLVVADVVVASHWESGRRSDVDGGSAGLEVRGAEEESEGEQQHPIIVMRK